MSDPTFMADPIKIKRDVEADDVAKSLTSQTLRSLGQWFQIATGGG